MNEKEYKFDHFKDIDEVMYYLNYWYKEDDVYSIDRYLSLRDFNYISNKFQELEQENKQLKERIKYLERSNNRREELIDEQRAEIFDLEENRDKAIEEIKKELKENNHLSYGVALSIIAILNNYEEILKGVSNE